MKKLLASLFVLLCFLNSYSQDLQKIDSLKRLLNLSKEDTSKVSLLIKLTKANKNNDIASAYKYCLEAINLSKKLKYNKGLFKALTGEISLIRIEGKDSLALEKSKRLVQFAESTKDSFNIAAGYLTLGGVYDNNGDNRNGVAYCLKGLSIAERMNDRGLLQDAYAELQRIYFSRSEFDKAIIYGQKAIDIAKAMGDKGRVMIQSYNLAQTYNLTKAFDKSIKISNEVVEMAKQAGDKRVEVYALYNLCSINLRTDKLSDALTYGKRCLAISKEISDKSIQSNVLAALGSIYLQRGQNKEAENNLLEALALRERTEDKQGIADVQNILANVYFAMGQPEKAYAFEKASEDFSDHYNQSILAQQSSDLEKKYETQKKESQIRLQQADIRQKNILNYVLLGGVLAILIISLLGYRNYKHRQKLQQAKIDELETEKQLTATEAILKGEEQERTRLAKDLHDGLGGMLSGIKFSLNNMRENLIMTPDNVHAFERSIDMLDSSIKEMRRVAHNMMPEILVKYGLDAALKEFCAEIDRSGVLHVNYQSVGMQNADIQQTTSITIYRIVQELLNNAMKHANAKNVLVQLHQSDQEKLLAVTVEDDGNGFDAELLKQSGGMGWPNIKNRVDFLKGRIDLQSNPGKGTSVMIEINI
ncbi:signal transduction histidine kinase [Pedobacter sp. AK013]|uniref:tetratricopeptide repeat-containing sensor histidine kinase n=1 Tax=Pedobacter sp. AK013 TaxID=2723071 RepID=UPI00160D4C75|nr:tetratricopeptide repeat protein [Pedobacter sp. AK013]MBB6235873.1 signal transduction histidine kinase [Pedobacter sp. AK013]